MFGVELGFLVVFTMIVWDDLPMGLPTPPLYSPGAVAYKYHGIYSGCYKEEGRVRSLNIRASCWSLHPDP